MSDTNAPFSDIADMTFEQAYAELNDIINRMEEGDTPLDESVRLFERGQALTKHCESLLDDAELRVNRLHDDGSIAPMG